MFEKKKHTLKIDAGVCESCRHARYHEYDPSPPGVALSPGTMTDQECLKEDELGDLEEKGTDISNFGSDADNQCPLWEPALKWCDDHKCWDDYECPKCAEERERQEAEIHTAKLKASASGER